MKPCRQCQHPISEQAVFCPNCGAPYPAKDKWDDHGFAQFALAYNLIAQLGIFIHQGRGQIVVSLAELLRHLT